MTTTISISSVFNAPAEKVWGLLGQVETLQTIAKPYAYFTQLDDMSAWMESANYRLKLRIFGIFPMGEHIIRVVRWNKASWSILTHENDRMAKIWNHAITLEPLPDGTTKYTDTVKLDAGRMTFIVRLWSLAFYRHRQRKWKSLLV